MSFKIIVVPRGKKWAVLVNYVQYGSEYSEKITADKMAAELRAKSEQGLVS